jgi:exopolysaccharide production protein ExoZ
MAEQVAEHPGRRELDGIQLIRGVAATAVAVFHTGAMAGLAKYRGRELFDGALNPGTTGVDLFFVLSGFIIVYVATLTDGVSPSLTVVDFLKRRFARIVPFLWCAILGYAAFRFAARREFDLWPTARAMVLWPVGELSPNVVWTLRHEALFYIVFALSFLRRAPWLLLPWVLAPLALAFTSAPELLAFLAAPVNLLFGMGVLIGMQFRRSTKPVEMPAWALVAAMGAVMGVAALIAYDRKTVGGVLVIGSLSSATLWIGARAALSGWLRRAAHVLGDASYSIYLTHLIALSAGFGLLPRLWKDAPDVAVAAILPALAVALGVAVHHLVEKPVVRLARRALAS